MLTADSLEMWSRFIDYVKKHSSKASFGNWIEPIELVESNSNEIILRVPNIFLKEYLLTNYKKELCAFLPVNSNGEPAINFIVEAAPQPKVLSVNVIDQNEEQKDPPKFQLNQNYRFENFIEGPTNQFVKSAAIGIASRPGKSYNPVFIHGVVGVGKTHILHSIGHRISEENKSLKIQCITTEGFINELVDHLRNKSVDRHKRFYRTDVDVLLVDDIQFLQNRPNFEEEFCNTFEALINQNKQIVITSDKPPSQLKLSERIIARMEWGLVAHIGVPDLETRVAILQHKARQRGFDIPNAVAFSLAERLTNNVRQLEGAVNRLCAHCRLMSLPLTQQLVEMTLKEILQQAPKQRVTVEQVLKSVAAVFQVRVSDLKGTQKNKEIALPRQIAMFLACKLVKEPLQMLGTAFGKTHSTLLHACKAVEKKMGQDDLLRRQIDMAERNICAG